MTTATVTVTVRLPPISVRRMKRRHLPQRDSRDGGRWGAVFLEGMDKTLTWRPRDPLRQKMLYLQHGRSYGRAPGPGGSGAQPHHPTLLPDENFANLRTGRAYRRPGFPVLCAGQSSDRDLSGARLHLCVAAETLAAGAGHRRGGLALRHGLVAHDLPACHHGHRLSRCRQGRPAAGVRSVWTVKVTPGGTPASLSILPIK